MKRFLVIGLIGMLIYAVCFAGKMENYSLKQVTKSPKEKKEAVHNMYVSSNKVRVEMSMPIPGSKGSMTMIVDQDAKKSWTVFEEKKTYFERPVDEKEFDSLINKFQDSQTVEKLGTEKVMGYKCTKEKVTSVMNVMGREIKSVHTIWKCDEFDFPLKVLSDDGT